MKILIGTLAAIVLAIVVIFTAGWLLPVGHVASRSAEFARPPHEVFATVSDVAAYPSWWPSVTKVEMLPPERNRMRFREYLHGDAIIMEVAESTPPTRFVTRIADPDQPFGGTWTFEIEPTSYGSRLTITERGEIYSAPFRFFARFVFGYTATMESFLEALAARGKNP